MEEMTTSIAVLKTRRFSSTPHCRATYCVSTIAFAIGMIPTIWYFRREKSEEEEEEEIDLDFEQLTLIT